MENVPGILTILDGAVMEEIYASLRALGYECEARILYAEDYGVPQERRRVFLIGSRVGPVAGSSRGEIRAGVEAGRGVKPVGPPMSLRRGQEPRSTPTVWCAIGDLPVIENGGGTDGCHTPRPRPAGTKSGCAKGAGGSTTMSPRRCTPSRSIGSGTSRREATGADIPFDLLPAGMQRARPSDHTKRYGRLSKQGLCCTILTKCDPHWGSYVHPEQDRAISIREAARLQSFADRFRFAGYRSEQFTLVGNAVPPLLAAAIARRIRRHLQADG